MEQFRSYTAILNWAQVEMKLQMQEVETKM